MAAHALPLLLLAACAEQPAELPLRVETKPRVTLSVQPQSCMAPCEVAVAIYLTAPAPSGVYSCPGIGILWGETAWTRYESECHPELMAEQARILVRPPPRRMPPGRHVVQVVVYDPLRYEPLARGSAVVEVR